MARKDKRQKIMQAAEKLFACRRFHEITLEEVAKDAKVGKGTIYLHFKDKDDLFFQTALASFNDLCTILKEKVPNDAPFEEQLRVACMRIAEFFKQRRQAHRMVQGEDVRMYWCKGEVQEKWNAKRQEMVGAVAAILRKGVGEGKIRQDVRCEILAHMLLAMLRTLAWVLSDDPKEQRKQMSVLLDLFCRGAGCVDAPVQKQEKIHETRV